jgi:hypothetical protein
MNERHELIPPPPVVRDRLAQNIKERRLLRSLLRISIRAAEERRQEAPPTSCQKANSRGVV